MLRLGPRQEDSVWKNIWQTLMTNDDWPQDDLNTPQDSPISAALTDKKSVR